MGRRPRTWVKLYCYAILHGSVSYQLEEAEQAVWVKLLCLAGLCGQDGVLADSDLRPLPIDHIIHEIHTTPEVFQSTLDKCKAEGRIREEDGKGITIVNWSKYQSEYERVKPYRDRKRDPHLFPGVDRAKHMAEQNERIMDAWEAAHPGQKHPMRMAAVPSTEE